MADHGDGDQVLEVACDESGSEGEKLVEGTTDVFAHASLLLDTDAAAACILDLRGRTRSPAEEYKAGVVLRARNRATLVWLLGPSGPVAGTAHVHLTEKAYFLVRALVALLLDGPPDPPAVLLHREAPGRLGPAAWRELLVSFNDLMRARGAAEVEVAAVAFLDLADRLRQQAAGTAVGGVLDRVVAAGADRGRLVVPLVDAGRMSPRLQPLVPALVRAVEHWGGDGRRVCLVHDQQHALTPRRIAHVRELLAADHGPELVDVRLVDSRSDPRVQVADLVAGAARRIASEELAGRGDPELVDLLRPYVDGRSIWGDRDRTRLAPAFDAPA